MKKKTGLLVCGMVLCLLFSFWVKQSHRDEYRYYDGKHLSSIHQLYLPSAVGREKADLLWRDILLLLDEAEKSFSFALATSEINRFNALPAQTEMEISPRFARLYMTAREYYFRTEGVFDPTIYPYLKLWGFLDGNVRVPHEEELRSLHELVGMDKLIFRQEGERYYLSKTKEEVTLAGESYRQSLDFGAVLKGYLCDEVKDLFAKYGIRQGSFQCGVSSLLVLGERNIQLKDPRSERVIGEVTVKDTFLSDSGDRYRYFEKDGVRYSHLIDPFSGKAAVVAAQSAVVLSDSGAHSDVYATVSALHGEGTAKSIIVREGEVVSKGVPVKISDKNYTLIEE